LLGGANKISITWIGHATSLVQIGGLNVLTDPIFSERASFLQAIGPKRKAHTPTALSELPRIDLVVISHNHYDHLDVNTIKALERQLGGSPIFAVPLGIDLWMKDLGISRVERFDWWDSKTHLGLHVNFLPSQHWSARGLTDRFATLWGSWLLKETDLLDEAGVNVEPAKSLFLQVTQGIRKTFLKLVVDSDR
jgi:N-acyl-phosphatidylethanolamine-hydrolysing phospholipase D